MVYDAFSALKFQFNYISHEAKIFEGLADAEKWLSSFGYSKTTK
jgi:hypothetical protein